MKTIADKEKLLAVIEKVPEEKIPEVIDFVEYLRIKDKLKSKEIAEFDKGAEKLSKEKNFSHLSEDDVIKIILEARKEKKS